MTVREIAERDAVIDVHSTDLEGQSLVIMYDLVDGRTGFQSFMIGETPREHPIYVVD